MSSEREHALKKLESAVAVCAEFLDGDRERAESQELNRAHDRALVVQDQGEADRILRILKTRAHDHKALLALWETAMLAAAAEDYEHLTTVAEVLIQNAELIFFRRQYEEA